MPIICIYLWVGGSFTSTGPGVLDHWITVNRRRFVAARRVLHVSSVFHFSAGFWLLTVLSFTSLVSSRHAACNERLIAVF